MCKADNLTIEKIRKRITSRKTETIGKHRFFSIIIPLIEGRDGIEVLFEVRSGALKTQPGDVCFPGGMIEAGETPLECALRELQEEIGVGNLRKDGGKGADEKAQAYAEVIGGFDTLHSFSGYTMYTFAAQIVPPRRELKYSLCLNPAEVAEVFTVPLKFFIDNPPKHYDVDVVSQVEDFPYRETGIAPDYNWRKGVNILPVYRYQDRVIWGVTARVVEKFAQVVCQDTAKKY